MNPNLKISKVQKVGQSVSKIDFKVCQSKDFKRVFQSRRFKCKVSNVSKIFNFKEISKVKQIFQVLKKC